MYLILTNINKQKFSLIYYRCDWMEEPLVSIIIVNYNGYDYLKENLDSLFNLEYQNFEIIFVDNNSQDNSVEFVKENYAKVKILALDKNYGFAQGNNLAMAKVNGKYIILLNPDTCVEKNWLTEIIKVAQVSHKVGIVGCKMYHFSNRDILGFGGSTSDKFGTVSQFGDRKKDKGFFNIQMKAFFITGACLLFKRELYEKIQLFDPSYFLYYEDVDFCWRAWICGYDVIYSPKPIIYHKADKPIKFEILNRILFYIERNRLRTILKNYELKNLLRILPNYFLKRLRFIFNTYFSNKKLFYFRFFCLLRSILWNLINLRSMIKYRIKIQANRKRDDNFIFNLMEELTNLRKKLER